MNREIRYLTFREIDDIFQDVYVTSWPGPKMSGDDEKFAILIQQESMKINGLQVPTIGDKHD